MPLLLLLTAKKGGRSEAAPLLLKSSLVVLQLPEVHGCVSEANADLAVRPVASVILDVVHSHAAIVILFDEGALHLIHKLGAVGVVVEVSGIVHWFGLLMMFV